MQAIKRVGDAFPCGMLLYLLGCSPQHPCLEHPTYNPCLSRVPCSGVPESPEQFLCVRQQAATAGSHIASATTLTAPRRVCFPLALCFVEMANPKNVGSSKAGKAAERQEVGCAGPLRVAFGKKGWKWVEVVGTSWSTCMYSEHPCSHPTSWVKTTVGFFLLNEDGFVRAPSDSSCSLSLSLDVTSSNSCKSHQAVGGFDSQQQLSPALERFTPGVWGVDRTQIGSAPDCRDWSRDGECLRLPQSWRSPL